MEFFTITDPSDWPSSMPELNTIDTLLRCGICYEFFDIAMILPKCSHNYCSICIRRHMNYKSQCPTCNTPAEVSQLCNNRALDELVSNFKAVRPLILKLCKEEAKKSDKGILQSPPSEPAGGKKKTIKETILSPPREQYGGKKTKKSSPYFKESKNDSDGDFTVESKGLASAETPRSKAQRRSNYQNTRDKIASDASELASSSAASPTRTASSSEEDPLMEPDASKVASSSTLNNSNEENIDPTYQIPADGDHSDEDVFAVVTPSKPSTSHGHAGGGPPSEKNLTPLTRSEKVDCPVCAVPISTKHINVHLDSCLTKIEEKEAKRRIPKRKPLPKIVSSLLSDKEMRKKLREHGLSSQGNRQILNKRLLEFTLMYNAQCDSINPMSVEAIVKDFNKIDKLKSQPNPVHVEQRLKVKRSLPEDEIAKAQEEYLKSHGSQFSDLIKNMKERACNSKKAGKAEGADKEQPCPSLPSVNKTPSVPKDDAMPGSAMLSNGNETSGEDTMCDGVTGGPPEPKKQSSAVTEDVKSVQNHGGPSAQPENTNSCDALPVDNDMPTEVYDVARKQDGGKGRRLKLKKSKYFEDSTKGIVSANSRVLSHEDEASVEKILGEGREESQMEEGIAMAIKMAENSEEQMDMMEDEVSPVFGQCSIGSSSSSSSRKAQSGLSNKKTDADGIDAVMSEKQKEVVPPSSVPPPPNTLLLNDFDTISEGSSLVTLESFSETGSHGDVPSPGDFNCIPESPEAVKGKRSKRIGRRKRKPEVNPEVNPEDDGIEAGKETRLTRSRKRGKTSAD